jgi:CubicO group peptidase (beta-lactamase class C family)
MLGMQRREFLVDGGLTALGLCLLPATIRAQAGKLAVETNGGSARDTMAALEKLIPELMREGRVPGASIALIENGRMAWLRGFGVRDAATGESVDEDSVFEAASISKSVFAYAVLKAGENGVLGLDVPLSKYAPKPLLEGEPRLDLVTPRHLLSHTSGLQNWRSDADPLRIRFTPGEKFLYSGEGYHYLQSVLTHLAGQPVEPFMQTGLFGPFGMHSSGYIWNERFEKHATRPHDGEGKPLAVNKTTTEHAERYAAAGALRTTPADYARFLLEILDPKPADPYRLSRPGLAEMIRPHIKVDETSSWALGWKIQHTSRGDLFQHHGGHKGAQAFASASLARKSGYVIMTNSDNGWKVFFNERFVEIVNRFLLG